MLRKHSVPKVRSVQPGLKHQLSAPSAHSALKLDSLLSVNACNAVQVSSASTEAKQLRVLIVPLVIIVLRVHSFLQILLLIIYVDWEIIVLKE